jgi:hypothetical protein
MWIFAKGELGARKRRDFSAEKIEARRPERQ